MDMISTLWKKAAKAYRLTVQMMGKELKVLDVLHRQDQNEIMRLSKENRSLIEKYDTLGEDYVKLEEKLHSIKKFVEDIDDVSSAQAPGWMESAEAYGWGCGYNECKATILRKLK